MKSKGGGSHIAPKSKYNEVVRFFPVSVDNFFDNPDKIVRYSQSLKKESSPDGNWPGKRSKELWKINIELSNALVMKILSCYYDLTYQSCVWERSNLVFQEIPRGSKNKNDVRNRGWIHFDSDTSGHPYEVAGLIYLTPDIDPDSGTSLFNLRHNVGHMEATTQHFIKYQVYKESEKFDMDFYTEKIEEEENFYIEKVRYANIYNRMIMYDTQEFHRANSYYNDDGKDRRLTLAFFIGGLNIGSYPLERIREKNCDEFIEYQIK